MPGRSNRATGSTVVLSAEPSIRDVAELGRRLRERLADSGPVTIDAAAVARVDIAVLQVLAAFVRDRRGGGLQTRWRQPSEALRSAAALVDLDGLLELEGRAR